MMDADNWNARYTDREPLRTAEPHVLLSEAVAELAPGTALDLACGQGRNALWLARNGWSVTAVDFSSVAVERGRAAAATEGLEVTFEIGDLLSWRLVGRAFDLVVLVYLQLESAGMSAVVAMACDAVAPGGTLIVVGHHLDNLGEGYGGPRSAEHLYTEMDLATWCTITAPEIERVARPVDTPEGTRHTVDALLIARR